MNRVSIIVPIYNTKKYLDRCVESLTNQTYNNIEIILIDDGSTDGSSEICEKYKNVDNRIQVVHQKNAGVSAARNQGIEIASGDYITFCDSDDYYEKDKIEIQLNDLLEKKTDVSIIGIQADYPNGKSRTRFNTKESYLWQEPNTEYIKFLLSDELFPFSQYALLIKRNICKQVRFWEGKRINEDKLFCYEILKKAKSVSFLSLSKYHYVLQNESATHTKFSEKYFDAIIIAKKMEKDIELIYPEWQFYATMNMCKTLISTLKYMLKDKNTNYKYRVERKKIISAIKDKKYESVIKTFNWKRKLETRMMVMLPFTYSKIIRVYTYITKKIRGGV